MAGTDHRADGLRGGDQPVVVLVRPQMGENIGAAARAMWNFGLDCMRIVAPRDGWPNDAARAMASGAGRVLDQVVIANDLENAVADLNYVYATTARPRDLVKDVLTPKAAMRDAHARLFSGQKVGILFGPERAGLENTDISIANSIISVPVNPEFGSLNLAQCVLLVAYEWLLSGSDGDVEPRTGRAELGEIAHLTQRLEERLDAAGFFFPADKAASMRLNLRNLFSRLPLTQGDLRILHGVVKTLGRNGKEAE